MNEREEEAVTVAAALSFDEAMWVRHSLASLLDENRGMLESLCSAANGTVRDDWMARGEGAIRKLRDATTRLLANYDGQGSRSLGDSENPKKGGDR